VAAASVASVEYQQIYDAALKQCRMLSGLRKGQVLK
jgi:hypothetical protein